MKISDLVTEDVTEDQIEEFGWRVKQDCSFYLNNKNADVNLYRGHNNKKEIVLDYQISQRNWSHTQHDITEYISKLMKIDGFIATRKDGLFVSPHPNVKLFGRPYIVFPVGKYSLTWFDESEMWENDLGAGSIEEYGRQAARDVYGIRNPTTGQAVKSFWEHYKHLFDQGTDVDAAVVAGSEVMLKAPSVHMIRKDIFEQYEEQFKSYWY